MAANPEMSPDRSPGAAPRASGVRRVNNLPVYIVGAALALFLVIMALVAADRARMQNRSATAKDEKPTATSMFAEGLVGKEKDGLVPTAALPLPAQPPEPVTPPKSIPDNGTSLPPPQPPGNPRNDDGATDPRIRIQQMKLTQLEEAIKAGTSVKASAPRSPGSAPQKGLSGGPASRDEASSRIAVLQQQIDAETPDDINGAYQAKLKMLKAALQGNHVPADNPTSAASTSQESIPSDTEARGKDYSRYGAADKNDRWQLDSTVQGPRTPYELRAGFVLPAILVSGINSDLPGQVIGQVSQDVFDTATGKWKLIPQGSRLIGQYSSDVAYGQARVLIAWQRIVFPDGKALDIGAMPGADGAGYSGFHDQVNNHYLRLFGSALLMSAVTAGIAISQPDYNFADRRDARAAMSEALGQQLGHVTAHMIAKNMGIAPTLEIRPGYRFNVVATKDLTFSKPYKPFDY